MKKKNYVTLLSAAMAFLMLWGSFSPLAVNAATDNAYASGLQVFIDEGSHSQLVECPDAVYMEYAELLRTDHIALQTMHLLGLIYGGLIHNDTIEPGKELYKQALLNIIRTYDEENAEIIAQQNLQHDTKEFEDYLQDAVGGELDWFEVIGASDWLDKKLGFEEGVALSVIYEMAKDPSDLAKGMSALKTTLQNYEKYDDFLQLIVAEADGELKLAAAELSVGLSEVMKTRLLAYADLVKDSAEDYAKLFVCEMFEESFFTTLEEVIGKHIGNISYLQAFQTVKLGVDIGKILGNLAVGAEDVLAYIVEIKAVHDISVILENELDGIMNAFQQDNFNITELDAQNYVAYGNYLISSRIRGQYCMTAIYMQCPGLQILLGEDAVKNAESLYNRLTSNLLNIKNKLDVICNTQQAQVVDALYYEKDLILQPSLIGMWDPQGLKHQIAIPKITLDTAAAEAFNQKIYNNHCGTYELLLSDQEDTMIFQSSYEYKVYNGVAAIAVLDGIAVQCGGGNFYYKVYYYSINEDRELTMSEYLEAIGTDYNTVLSRIMASDAYMEATQDAWEPITDMTDCLLDENGTSAFFINTATMDGWSEIETISVLDG